MRARVLVLAVLATVLAAAPAHAASSHLLDLYKVETHVDLQGEDGFYDIACNGTDIAINGMWRIDAVDQDNEFSRLTLLSSVYPVSAYPLDDSSYRFQFTPTLGGDVQVKLWLTCLGRKTAPDTHQHTWSLSTQQATVTQSSFANVVDVVPPTTCPPDAIAVQPGWQTTTSGALLRPYRSWPTATFRGWHFGFIVDTPPATVTFYLSCLTVRSSSTNGHRHRIVHWWNPNFAGSVRALPVTDNRHDEDLHCGELYKAMLGAWWIDDPFHVWFYGMEPRPKTRTFWFGNDGGGSSFVWIAADCWKVRTT